MWQQRQTSCISRQMKNRHIVIVTFPGCQLLDVSGPASVFATAAEVPGTNPYKITLVSSQGGEIASSCGIGISTQSAESIAVSSIDLLLVAGGSEEGLRLLCTDQKMASWARAVSQHAARFGSVCTGSFVIAAWGLADGKRIATHWASSRLLSQLFPSVTIDPDPIYVEDGKLWTSAGITTGIDMALAIVARDHGEGVAASVARHLVLPLRRHGNQAQHSLLLEAQAGIDGRYAELASWIVENIGERIPVAEMAKRVGESERSFQRRFRQATGRSPAAFVGRLRLEHARDLVMSGRSVKEAARACGFISADHFSRAYTRAFGVPPSALKPRAPVAD
jgi:transcriptional regulator GlxA family with amidase domain